MLTVKTSGNHSILIKTAMTTDVHPKAKQNTSSNMPYPLVLKNLQKQ
jgi:hypothetical protein